MVSTSEIINSSKDVTNCDFTTKDFRTWGGTLEALRQLGIKCKFGEMK